MQATLLRWLPVVTDGRYTQAAVDPQTLQVRVKTGSGKWVEASQLSVGTAEQIYLLLRVALVIHLSDPATSCPLLLDDVTVQADPVRTRALLDTLAQLAQERQVILFAQEPAVEQWARESGRCQAGDAGAGPRVAGAATPAVRGSWRLRAPSWCAQAGRPGPGQWHSRSRVNVWTGGVRHASTGIHLRGGCGLERSGNLPCHRGNGAIRLPYRQRRSVHASRAVFVQDRRRRRLRR